MNGGTTTLDFFFWRGVQFTCSILSCPFARGSGFHLPSAPHLVIVVVLRTNPELHLKGISAPSVVFWYGSTEPFPGVAGSLQFTGWRRRLGPTHHSEFLK